MKTVLKRKWEILFDALIVVWFLSFEPNSWSYYPLLGLFAFQCLMNHIKEDLAQKLKETHEVFNKYEKESLIKSIEDLSMEIVYPQMSHKAKAGLLKEVSKLKEIVLKEPVQ